MKQPASYAFISPLNAVRFFAAIAIVIYHYGRWSFPFSWEPIQPLILNANTGVTLFFVLSGFIMVHVYGKSLTTLRRESIVSFYRARIARIVPLYVVALALTVWSDYVTIGTATLTMLLDPASIKPLILQLFFLQSWIPGQSLLYNFTGWSLSVELFFYLLFPLAFFLFRKLRPQLQLVATVGLWLVSNLVTFYVVRSYFPDAERANEFIKFFPLLHLNSFLVGMCAGMWFSASKRAVPRVLTFLSCLILITLPFLVPEGMWPAFHNGFFAPAFGVLIVALSRSRHFVTSILAHPSLVLGGDISYGLYILQVPVYNWVYFAYAKFGIFDTLHEEGRFFVYLVLLCIASWISLKTVEAWGKRVIRGAKNPSA